MRRLRMLPILLIATAALATSANHVITFGKWLPVKWFVGPTEDKVENIKIRPLYVDGHLREFTMGDPHDVTERVFVVRRAYRINDILPEEPRTPPKWMWQRGGWLMVDRLTGRVTQLNLPDFDPFYSAVSWYRDYVAYCGVNDDTQKLYAVVVQLGVKRPILHKELGQTHELPQPDSECAPPEWQRGPARVTFQPQGAAPLTYNVRGSAASVVNQPEQPEGSPQ